MISECPHCYTRVVPNSEGECPSCRNNVRDAESAGTLNTSLPVRHLADLPAVCCQCACATDRYVKITRQISREKEEEDSSAGIALMMGGWIFALVALLLGDFRSRSSDVVVVRMPQCDLCGANGSPDPIRVNSEELHMTFVVHKGFKRRLMKDRV